MKKKKERYDICLLSAHIYKHMLAYFTYKKKDKYFTIG